MFSLQAAFTILQYAAGLNIDVCFPLAADISSPILSFVWHDF
jgi:hypothetical protein